MYDIIPAAVGLTATVLILVILDRVLWKFHKIWRAW